MSDLLPILCWIAYCFVVIVFASTSYRQSSCRGYFVKFLLLHKWPEAKDCSKYAAKSITEAVVNWELPGNLLHNCQFALHCLELFLCLFKASNCFRRDSYASFFFVDFRIKASSFMRSTQKSSRGKKLIKMFPNKHDELLCVGKKWDMSIM